MKRGFHIVSSALVLAAALPAAADDAWAPLGLARTNLYGVVVHFSPSLAGDIPRLGPVIREVKAQTRESRARLAGLKERKGALLEELNRLVGLPPGDASGNAGAGLDALLPLAESPLRFDDRDRPFTLYVVLREPVRALLREGGSLPGFTWDPATGKAEFNATAVADEDNRVTGIYWLPLPVDEPGAFEEALRQFRSAGRLGESPAGLLVHQVVRARLQGRLNPGDPFHRWFTDGFAKQLTYHLVQEYLGLEEGRRFMAYFDVGRYEDLRQELNLRFWPAEAYEIPVPYESERRFRNARHAYSAFEIGRVVSLHGIECLAPILEKARARQPMPSRALFDAIREVTGVDIAARLKRYMVSPDMVKVVEGLRDRLREAEQAGDRERVLRTMLRISELNPRFEPSIYFHAARMLFEGGHRAASARVFTHALEHLEGPHRDAVHGHYVDFLLKTNQPLRALNHSAEVLKRDPAHAPSLSVQMLHAIQGKRWFDAEGLAREILKHDPEAKQIYAQNAQRILAEIESIGKESSEAPDSPE